MAKSRVLRSLPKRILPSLVLPLFMAACGPPPPPPPPPAPDTVCSGSRWIGIMPPASTCASFVPPGPGWIDAPLFPGATSPTLSRYCLFTWDTSVLTEPSAADLAALTASAGALDGFAEDCPIVMPLGFPEQSALDQRARTHAAAGGLPYLPNMPAPNATRLSVVDNAPSATVSDALPEIQPHSGGVPFGEHGEVLAYLGRDIGCPEGKYRNCAVHVETALALRDGGNPTPESTGGLTGRRGDLAIALHETVDRFRDDVLQGAEPRLVINLSVGWESHSHDDDCHVSQPQDLNAPSRAVYDAMLEARCHGALMVAAAGNDTGHDSPGGLMCPAHYASWLPPECDESIVDTTFVASYEGFTGLSLRPPTTAYDPLVHPVGAVDHGDAPLVPHRPESLPMLVAPGLLGASYEGVATAVQVAGTLPAVAPYPLTGTSVSAAIVSAIAATTWAYEPSLAPANIMMLLHAHGAMLSPTAEASPLVVPQRVHRASLCRTLRGLGYVPPAMACPDPHPGAVTGQNQPFSSTMVTALEEHYLNAPRFAVNAATTQHTPLMSLHTEAAAIDLAPQPAWPSCPTCGIQVSIKSLLYVDPPLYQRMNNTCLVVESNGSFRSYELGAIQGTSSMVLSSNVGIAEGARVYLSWEDGNGFAAYAQIPIY